MINNGIINIGNNNKITVNNEIDYSKIKEELEILAKNYQDDLINKALKYSIEKDKKKLIKCLKSLSKEALSIIKYLSLTTLQKIIEQELF